LTWLERERVNLIAAGRSAWEHGYAELAWHLSNVLWPLFLHLKHYADRMEVDTRGVAAAQAWGNAWAEAVMLMRLGRSCTLAGDYGAAERHTRAAIVRYRESGDVRGRLDAEEGLAMLYRDSGRHERAATVFAEVLAENRALGADRHAGLTLINLGMLFTTLDRPGEAVGLLAEAREIFAELSDVDPHNQARVLIGMAGAYLGIGDLTSAELAAAEAAGRMRDLGSDFERAEAHHLLGRVALQQGDAQAAHGQYRLAIDVFDALGSSRAAVVRRDLADLGDTGGSPDSHGGPPPVQERGQRGDRCRPPRMSQNEPSAIPQGGDDGS
jgi:tetratricopeptide (TPR) repeat protein